MKKLISFIVITFSLFLLHACFKANDNVGHDGRCTGSAYCTACKNCSRCGHCSGGGTCGVCGSGSSRKNSSSETSLKKNKSKKHKTSEPYKSSKTKSNKPPKVFIDEVNADLNSPRYITGITTTNIYEKPSSKSKIIATVPKNTKLVQLSKQGSWYKVQLPKSKKTGFIYKEKN